MKMAIAALCLLVAAPVKIYRHTQAEIEMGRVQLLIMQAAPRLSLERAREYAKVVYENAVKFDLSPVLMVAIIRVESNFRHAVTSVTRDHGPMQVNEYWVRRLGIKPEYLRTVVGGIEWGSQILMWAREEASRDKCWWSIYNTKDVQKRRKYEVRVERVIATMGLRFECSGVKRLERFDLASWRARNPVYASSDTIRISAAETGLSL